MHGSELRRRVALKFASYLVVIIGSQVKSIQGQILNKQVVC